METFQRQWPIYQKLVDHNYLSHREAYAILHQVLVDECDRPFRLLELACGDAKATVEALQNTAVVHYQGVDLSKPALEMAQQNLKRLPCEAELEQWDFIAALGEKTIAADVVWLSLSLHHLSLTGKGKLFAEVRQLVGDRGLFLIYEPTLREGEKREDYLARFEKINRPQWVELTADEWNEVFNHVKASDFPETAKTWESIAREQEFTQVRQLFVDPTDMYALFCFHG
ncbi:MAG: methyltransferase domain-containing protein, partial [Microcystaceae cyanobacterium]